MIVVRVCIGHVVPDITIRWKVHAGIYSRRVSNDTPGKRRNITRRRHGKCASLQVVFILKAKSDSVSDTPNHLLTLAPKFGPGVTPGARLTRVVPLCVGPTPDPATTVNQTATGSNPNNPPDLQDQILNHISSLKSHVQLHNESPTGLVRPIRLSFDDEGGPEEKNDEESEDLQKHYKEVLKSPFSRRIIEFSAPNHRTPTNLKIYDGSTDPDDHITRFVGAANQGEWEMPVWQKCCEDQTEVSKIVRKANKTLLDFQERWTEEMSYIPNVPVVMQMSSFMRNSKCPELARRFSDQVPKTVTEMMKRVDDFVKLEEVFKNTELPKEEHPEKGTTVQFRESRPPCYPYGSGPSKPDAHNRRDHYQPYVPPRAPNRRYDNRRHDHRSSFNPNPNRAGGLIRGAIDPHWEDLVGGLRELGAVSSTVHAMMKFPTPKGIASLCARAEPVYECRWSERNVAKQEETKEKAKEQRGSNIEGEEKIPVNLAFPEQTVTIGTQFSTKCRERLIRLLKYNMDVFAWQPSDMIGVPRRLIKHALNVNNFVPPVAQKRRVIGIKKSRVVTREVGEWVKAGIVRPVKYPTWISNLVLMSWDTPSSASWMRTRIPPGPKEDEEKTTFYTNHGTYCYVKMPFDLKNVEAIYERGGEVPRLHGNLGRNKGEPQEDEGNIRHAIP
ncbi:hypothetical protein Tco_0551935 [Tanacetum coccineum]